jgi:guanylate kinase
MIELGKKELIFAFTGPDGSGRKTVSDMVGETLGIPKVVSYTTRKPRSGEVPGHDYHYTSFEQFTLEEAAGLFLETVEIGGVKYGIKEADLRESLDVNGHIYAVLNTEGCEKLRALYGTQVVTIFLHLDVETIVARQQQAGSAQDLIDRHVAFYAQENAYQNKCDYSFENRDSAHTAFAITKLLEPYLNRNLIEED